MHKKQYNRSTDKTHQLRTNIRNRQIQQFKWNIRHYYPLIIQYSNPSATIQKLQSLIITSDLDYIPKALQTISELVNNYEMCRLIAYHQIFEKLLVKLVCCKSYRNGENIWEIIMFWVDVVEKFIGNWFQLIDNLCHNIPEILWGLIIDQRNQDFLVDKLYNLLILIQHKYPKTKTSPNHQQIKTLINYMDIPIICLILSDNLCKQIENDGQLTAMTLKRQELIHDNQVGAIYLDILSRMQFIQPEILDSIYSQLRYIEGEKQKIILKILYQQMYLTDVEVLELASRNTDPSLIEYVRELVDDDF